MWPKDGVLRVEITRNSSTPFENRYIFLVPESTPPVSEPDVDFETQDKDDTKKEFDPTLRDEVPKNDDDKLDGGTEEEIVTKETVETRFVN